MINVRKLWEEKFSQSKDEGVAASSIGGHKYLLGNEMVDGQSVPVIMFPAIRLNGLSAGGFEVSTKKGRLGKDDPEQDFLKLKCLNIHLRPVFFRFLDEVMDLLTSGSSPQEAVTSAYAAWQQFIFASKKGRLEDKEIVGLWGELNLLLQLIDKKYNPIAIVKSWDGPKGSDWDFELPSLPTRKNIEVKTTRSKSRTITVNNPQQLCTKAEFDWLCFIRVSETAISNGGVSLTGLVNRTLNGTWAQGVVGSEFRKILWGKLEQAGYSPRDEDYYSEQTFQLDEELWYKVGPDFPVLRETDIRQDIRARISEFRYMLSLAGLIPEPFPKFEIS